MKYRLASRPLKLLSRHDLPKKHTLEDWESEDGLWFRHKRTIYNLQEFCTANMPRIPGPLGGAQTASNGYFMIAAAGNGEVYSVHET